MPLGYDEAMGRDWVETSHQDWGVEGANRLWAIEAVADDDTDSYLQRWRRLSLDLPVDGVLPDVAGTVELRRDGRSAVLLTADYQPTLEAALSAAGITVHQSQRLTLEEIFVASVMQHRQERGE